jgi:hypothetical protein
MRSSFFFLVARDKHAGGATSRNIHNPEKRLCGFLSSTGGRLPNRLGERITEWRLDYYTVRPHRSDKTQ